MRPPESETDAQRRARLEKEQESKRISDEIDEQIRQEREKLKKYKEDVKLLLLGQAESGKSTLQKQFQLMYNPASLERERLSWRTVVYFNVVRSIRRILDTLEAYDDASDDGSATSGHGDGTDTVTGSPSSAHALQSNYAGSSQSHLPRSDSAPPASESQKQIATLRLRLSPLVLAEAGLGDRLSGGVTVSGSGKGGVFVRNGWQNRTLLGRRQGRASIDSRNTELKGDAAIKDEMVEDVARMLDASKDDIKELWEHPTVRRMISKRKLRLEEWSHFFLNDIMRIAQPGYTPTIDDILHARIQTMGVAEHTFDVDLHGKSVTWHLFDVGGARGQRHSWIPYFDDANAIIFVAPISAFDQYLEEDARTNRIDDSLQLFTQICSNQLLKKVHLVLFLNKTDVLQAKLASGLKVNKYITSFGDRPNEYESVVSYFRAHFLQVHKKNNENKRVLYTHLTNVTDTLATQSIIANVRDSIFRGYLKSAALV
ncbi:G-protein alpha subunit [Gloeophyllum trabeum ATCC 11539]|uniref:G-protein alpha subunit n=1 Tax=Gloeophyllum trabeum (strain ATCC 11539 / FP-39264 / Madison 617) TaxID=670483 RepID=S7PYB8_GLOTA|nr:G-protein alpha subunit [Gloeophyllum trabeum ATCC 11539]EPQ52636.1 G-protein alpha subunit [Gloeophyllum trabeum ATCC 11539]